VSSPTLISSTEELAVFVSPMDPPAALYLDLEGVNLSRHGTISILTILPKPQGKVRVIDVLSLASSAFTTTSKNGKTSLKPLLQDPGTPKCLWDARSDADALWARYQVRLAGVVDIQLLENASRVGNKTLLCGLDKAVRWDLGHSNAKFPRVQRWFSRKDGFKALMDAEPNIFDVRPIAPETLQYWRLSELTACTPNIDIIHFKAFDLAFL
ncbi:hypothetical protein B0H67DRAFT_488412, partial [Lasiosphaeris hirsuta]